MDVKNHVYLLTRLASDKARHPPWRSLDCGRIVLECQRHHTFGRLVDRSVEIGTAPFSHRELEQSALSLMIGSGGAAGIRSQNTRRVHCNKFVNSVNGESGRNFISLSLSYTHTHTRTHARTHARTYARTHARTYARTHARTRTRARTHTHSHTHTHTRTHARTHTHTHTHTRARARAPIIFADIIRG